MYGGQLRAALSGTFFWIWVFSTSVFIVYISNKLNKSTMINKLPFVALLATSLVISVILVVMDDFFIASNVASIYLFGFMIDIPVFVVAVLGLMRERIKQLIIFCVIGAVLVIGYDYYYQVVYVIPHRDPGVLWHFGMVGYAIMGLLFGSGLLENSRYGRMAFVSVGVLFVNFFLYINLYALFFILPLLALTTLLIRLLLRKPIAR